MAITRRQREVYDFISRFIAKHGHSPSYQEIMEGLGLNSLATVHKHVTNLEKSLSLPATTIAAAPSIYSRLRAN